MRRLIPFLLLTTMLGACGGGGEAELSDALGAAIWQEAQPEDGSQPAVITEAAAGCIGEAFVSSVGFESFESQGITADAVAGRTGTLAELVEGKDLGVSDPEVADALYNGVQECVDLQSVLAPAMSAELEISDESATCFIGGLVAEEGFRATLVQSLIGTGSLDVLRNPDPTMMGTLLGLLNTCLSPEELSKILSR